MTRFYLPKSESEARAIQDELRQRLRLTNDFESCEVIAGVDVGYDVENGLAHASVVTMSLSDLRPIEVIEASVPVDFPYIPGMLAFREIPAILDALDGLLTRPDLFMVDGQGIAHPRRMGIAAHLGLILDKPSLGVAKSRLTGRFEMPGPAKGEQSPLMVGQEQVGVVLRSKDEVNPLFVSPGHKIDMETAVKITLKCLTRFKLPEPTRLADKLSKVRPSAFQPPNLLSA